MWWLMDRYGLVVMGRNKVKAGGGGTEVEIRWMVKRNIITLSLPPLP